jgi:RNA polymerase sigma-70 factor (ECF subfamily)
MNSRSALTKTGYQRREQLNDIVVVANERRRLFHQLALRYLGNTADAEDAVQDALLLAIKNIGQFKGNAQLSTWLTRIVINASLMKLRRRSRYLQFPVEPLYGPKGNEIPLQIFIDHRPNPEEILRKEEESTRLQRMAALLSPVLQQTYHLREVQKLSIRETARILGVSEGAVKARGSRARARLKQLMKRHM